MRVPDYVDAEASCSGRMARQHNHGEMGFMERTVLLMVLVLVAGLRFGPWVLQEVEKGCFSAESLSPGCILPLQKGKAWE